MNGFSFDLDELREAARYCQQSADQLTHEAKRGDAVSPESMGVVELAAALDAFWLSSNKACLTLAHDVDTVSTRLADTRATYRALEKAGASAFHTNDSALA